MNADVTMEDFELEKLRRDGELRVARVFSPEEFESLRLEAERILVGVDLGRGGLREVLGKSPAFAELAGDGLPARLARQVLGPASRVRKATLFDKTPAANWKVPWHQDLTIAVAERREIEGFPVQARNSGWRVQTHTADRRVRNTRLWTRRFLHLNPLMIVFRSISISHTSAKR